MDDLTFTLRTRCLRNRDGSHATQADRPRALVLMSRQLRENGFRQMRATSLKGKHVASRICNACHVRRLRQQRQPHERLRFLPLPQ